jgi:mono/diheme cytochrome c family protein
MRRTFAFAVVVALTGHEAATAAETARRQFQTSCLGCHQPPDLTFPTDRAWLGQIHRTA